MTLLTGNENDSHVNLHHLLMTLFLCNPHFDSMKTRLFQMIDTICFLSDDKKITRSDFDYLFQLAYYQIKIATSLSFQLSQTHIQLSADLFPDDENDAVDVSKLIASLETNEDLNNLVFLFSYEGQI